VLEPLLRRLLQLGGHDGGLWEPERSGGAAQPVGVTAQVLDRRLVVAGRYEALGELGDRPELVAGPLQVLVADAGGKAEVVDRVVPCRPANSLDHGLQDITSFCFDL